MNKGAGMNSAYPARLTIDACERGGNERFWHHFQQRARAMRPSFHHKKGLGAFIQFGGPCIPELQT